MASLTRCTAAKGNMQIGPAGPCRRGHLGGTSAGAAGRGGPFWPGQAHSAVISGSGPTGQATALHPHGRQIRTGVRYFSQRLLLYFAAVRGPGTLRPDFRIIVLELVWSYGDSNPRPLACHESLASSPTRPYAA